MTALSNSRSVYTLIARAARMIQNNADCLRQCHTQNGDWGGDREAQQIHDEEVRTVMELRSLIATFPARTQATHAIDPCPQCIPGRVCKTPTCGRLAASNNVPAASIADEAVEYRCRGCGSCYRQSELSQAAFCNSCTTPVTRDADAVRMRVRHSFFSSLWTTTARRI